MPLTQDRLDALWDFSDPSASEAELRGAAAREEDPAVRAELMTQVARALGLQERCADADAVLDEIARDEPAASVRVALERGRLRNSSSGDVDDAIGLFRRAAEEAASHALVFLQVDALHMLAIADAAHSARWTAEALAVLSNVQDRRTLRWRVSLHNNHGWTLFDQRRTEAAIAEFERAKEAAIEVGTAQQVEWAEEALAEARASLDPSRD